MEKITGIYKITNLVNRKVYIGASVNVADRWYHHQKDKRSPIYNDREKYGIENFRFEILLECPEDMLRQWERDMICLYDSDNPQKGYNSPNDQNYQFTKRSREKLSESHKGKTRSIEVRRRVSEAMKGNQYALGNSLSKEHKRRISEANRGKITSEETKEKISNSLKGRKLSEETKRRISEANRGKITSEETKEKISNSLKGKAALNKGKKLIDGHYV